MSAASVTRGDGPIILGQPHGGTFVPSDIAARLNSNGKILADTDWHITDLYADLVPDLTILMDIDPSIGLSRAAVRAGLDTMELRDQAFHARLRRRFLELAAAEPHRYLVLDASRGVDELAADIGNEVAQRIGVPIVAAAAV